METIEAPTKLPVLAARRMLAGLSQDSLARAVGVDRALISRWERGFGAPSPAQAATIGQSLGMSAEEVLDAISRATAAIDAARRAGGGE